MKKMLGILACCVFYACVCHAGPFGVGMGDQISHFPKLQSGSFNEEPCYIWKRPIIIKKVPGKFMLFFENGRLAKMTALSDPVANKRQAEKYFKEIYAYIAGFGGMGELPDGHKYVVSQVSKRGPFDITWHDYKSDPFSSEENEICRMNLKMTQDKAGMYVIITEIIYRNAQACKRGAFNGGKGRVK